jgi:Zn-dependent protease
MILLLSDLASNPPALVAFLAAFGVALIGGISFHEFSHAWAAYQMGDDTAARQGRLTLNPASHVEPLWVVVMLLIGFGKGKPTPFNPYRLRTGFKAGSALVAVAGPSSNLVLAIIAALPLRLGWVDSIADLSNIPDASGEEILGLFLYFIVYFNVLLFVFNMLPIPMLDGYKVLWGVLPDPASLELRRFEQRLGWAPLMVLVILSWTPISPLGWLLSSVHAHLLDFIL